MAWPHRPATTDDVWPEAEDLFRWIREESVAATSDSIVGDAFRTADQLLRSRISPDLLTQRATEAGIETDPDAAAFDAATLEAWCPAYVRQAILIRAAAIYTRRDSTNGTIAFAEFAVRVAKRDPDVDELMRPVVSVLV
ncbi:MAG: hypothetical protein AAFP84_21650 [Actinomycetota bacterium]